jgi:aspartate-semialdehyde dehydrogenase
MFEAKESGYRVAVVGATGAVGREMVRTLGDRQFPVASLRLFASSRSAGERLAFRGEDVAVEALGEAPDGIDIALFSAGAGISREAAPGFAARGAVVIDNSSAWRMDPQVPLVVPEVNGAAAFQATGTNGKGIIANPNCSTIQMVVALQPLHAAFGLRRVVVSTYQSVSGAGQKGIDELKDQVTALFNGREPELRKFPHAIAFNSIPAIGGFRDDGYTDEEWKLVAESRKIMGIKDLRVSPTCVRIPVFSCHSESVHAEFSRKVTPKEALAALRQAEGVVVQDVPADQVYPMGFPSAGTDPVYVGRMRQDPDDDRALNFWVVSDNLRKGAALNAVQIAELLHAGPEDEE